LHKKKIKNSEINPKKDNGLEVFGTIMTYIFLFILQIHSKINIKSLLKQKSQNTKLGDENEND
jgi:hypothetical protein